MQQTAVTILRRFLVGQILIVVLALAAMTRRVDGFVLPSPSYTKNNDKKRMFHTKTSSTTALAMSIIPATIQVNDLIESRKMVLFGMTTCGQTMRLVGLLDSGHVHYTRVNLDQLPQGPDMMEALEALTGRSQVPLVFCRGKYMGTIDSIIAMNVAGRLGPYLLEQGVMDDDRLRQLHTKWTSADTMGFADGPHKDSGDWSLV